MSTRLAQAYRDAAEYLSRRPAGVSEGYDDAIRALRHEADELDGINQRNARIGETLREYLTAGWESDAEIGRRAWELVNADRKLHKPPTADELTARDNIEN